MKRNSTPNAIGPRRKKKEKAAAQDGPTYHHGALRSALLEAAETILRRDGIEMLTLRGVAREVGVSHAAPKNHFDDMRGLLSELAAVGFSRLATEMKSTAEKAIDTTAIMDAIGKAYVQFARANSGLFLLMYRSEMLDFERNSLRDARAASSGTLAATIEARRNEGVADDRELSSVAEIAAAWSLVHGYAMLLIDQRLSPLLDHVSGDDKEMKLLSAVLASVKERKAHTAASDYAL